MDAKSLLLLPSDVPNGFSLRDEADRVLDLGGEYADQAHRMYGKPRFLKAGDAIWSEATVFPNAESSLAGWTKLVEYHKANPTYDDVRPMSLALGDHEHVHAGTMSGRPGLWAAVRIGTAVHRFNTYGVDESASADLLRRQLARQASNSGAISEVDAVQMSWVGFIDAFGSRDLDQINEWWLRLQLAVQKGRFKDLQPLLDQFWDATGSDDQSQVKRSAEGLSAAIAALSE